jgi:hypothetical protein
MVKSTRRRSRNQRRKRSSTQRRRQRGGEKVGAANLLARYYNQPKPVLPPPQPQVKGENRGFFVKNQNDEMAKCSKRTQHVSSKCNRLVALPRERQRCRAMAETQLKEVQQNTNKYRDEMKSIIERCADKSISPQEFAKCQIDMAKSNTDYINGCFLSMDEVTKEFGDQTVAKKLEALKQRFKRVEKSRQELPTARKDLTDFYDSLSALVESVKAGVLTDCRTCKDPNCVEDCTIGVTGQKCDPLCRQNIENQCFNLLGGMKDGPLIVEQAKRMKREKLESEFAKQKGKNVDDVTAQTIAENAALTDLMRMCQQSLKVTLGKYT